MKVLNLSGPNLGTNHSDPLEGNLLSVGLSMLWPPSIDAEKALRNTNRGLQIPEPHFPFKNIVWGELPHLHWQPAGPVYKKMIEREDAGKEMVLSQDFNALLAILFGYPDFPSTSVCKAVADVFDQEAQICLVDPLPGGGPQEGAVRRKVEL